MPNQNPNGGRNIAHSDENRQIWRPGDPASQGARGRADRGADRGDEDREYRAWRDRSYRDEERPSGERETRRWEAGRGADMGYSEDRELARSTERHGQGQSGYSAGRYGEDRAQQAQMQSRSELSGYEDRSRDFGVDDRFTGRGRSSYWMDRPGGYDPERYGAQGGYGGGRGFEAERLGPSREHEERGYEPRGAEQRSYQSQRYEPRGYEERGHEQRYGAYGGHEQRGAEQRGFGERGYEQRGSGERGYEQRGAEQRGFGERGYEQRGAEQRGHEQRGYGERGYGERGYGERGYGERGYGERGFGAYGSTEPRIGSRQGSYDRRTGYSSEPEQGRQYMGYPSSGGYGSQQQQDWRRFSEHMHRGTGPHRGKGPHGYQRSDERVREMVCEALSEDDEIDATQIQVAVRDGEVTLSGTVDNRQVKREAEDCVSSISGVRDVQNLLRVRGERSSGVGPSASSRTAPGQTAGGQATSSAGATSAGSKSESESPAQDRKHRA